jgi:hypothetical protein
MMILFLTRKLGAGDKPCPDPAMVWGDYHRLVCECLHEIPKRKVGSYHKKKKEMDQCAQILRRKGCKLPSELGKVGLLRTTHKREKQIHWISCSTTRPGN